MNGERKAALALASLGEADRAWLLERLPEEPRARVAALLGELSEMRVSFDRELMAQLGKGEPPKKAEPPQAELLALHGFDVDAVAAVLAPEPDWLAALVIGARPWPWRDAFLQRRRLPPGTAELKPKALAALLAAFEARLREAPAAARPVARPFWRRRIAWR